MSFGEIVKVAALDTLMGMLVVFAVLILISLLIYCLRYIPMVQNALTAKLEARKKAKKADGQTETPVEETVAVPSQKAEISQEEAPMEDLTLIAVITAAIAAATDVPADGIVIRSIRRSGNQNWKHV
jgi:Na+-transporting methylmalonyl-CoA/oxaloacetate decarboxylase gamma subunit